MNRLAELRTKQGFSTIVNYDFSSSFDELVEKGNVDCFIVSTEDGFSPLGVGRSFFAQELGVNQGQIRSIANWNRNDNQEISFIAISSKKKESRLKGIILAASETSKCYEQFAVPRYGNPYRDFYYNVSYEAIAYASEKFGAKKLAMTHLSASGSFHADIATCNCEALAHFTEGANKATIESFSFVGCCINNSHLQGISRLNSEGGSTKHIPIKTNVQSRDDFEVVTLEWK